VDHDFPISHSITEHGAILYQVLLVALVALCIVLRRRFPLACFGVLTFLIWLAPTSSIIPIRDPLVERRMYLALVGLILVGCDVAGRLRFTRLTGYAAIALILIFFASLCYRRNQLWKDPVQLWGAAAMQSTSNGRPYANLVDELVEEQRCKLALPYLQHADQVLPNDYYVQMAWGRALECLGRREEAMQHLQHAAKIQPTAQIYELIGLLYGEMGQLGPAGFALQRAVELEPASARVHDSYALWYEANGNLAAAQQEYLKSLALNPADGRARAGLARLASAPARR
jgi:tetratricopeptide (TPR) repeat protein